MRNIYSLFRFIHRRRHAAGFGVHSPFAFNLILDTIYTPHSYYIYEDNRRKIDRAKLNKEAHEKYSELLFRLINRFKSKDILEIGSGFGINTLYISAPSKQTSVLCVEQKEAKAKIAQSLLVNKLENIIFTNTLPTKDNRFDAIVWDLKQYPIHQKETLNTIECTIKTGGFVVVNHINKGKENKDVWQKILQIDTLTMSFDLGAIGIGFFKPSLPKLNYDLYFSQRNKQDKY